jgi:DNA-directed RNA polymerase specialized sigma24 family protein
VVRGIDRFEGRSSLKTWIFRILANRAQTRGGRDAREMRANLDSVIEALPDRQRR